MFSFDHTALSVSDLDRSVAFYTKLEFALDQRWDAEDGSLSIVQMKDAGGAILELFCYRDCAALPEYRTELVTDLPVLGTKHMALHTADVHAAAKSLLAAGVLTEEPTVLTGRLGRSYFFIRDPDGIPVEIIEAEK